MDHFHPHPHVAYPWSHGKIPTVLTDGTVENHGAHPGSEPHVTTPSRHLVALWAGALGMWGLEKLGWMELA